MTEQKNKMNTSEWNVKHFLDKMDNKIEELRILRFQVGLKNKELTEYIAHICKGDKYMCEQMRAMTYKESNIGEVPDNIVSKIMSLNDELIKYVNLYKSQYMTNAEKDYEMIMKSK